MKIKKHNSAKTLLLATASKIALAPSLAAADHHGGGGGGKGDEGPLPDPAPQLKLNQFVQPVDAYIPPFNDEDMATSGTMYEDEYGSYDNAGVIFVGDIPETGARMDFVVSHIRNDKPVDVFVVCGTQLAPDEEGDLFPGMDIDYEDYEDYEDMDGMMPRQANSRDTRKRRPSKPQPGNGNKPPVVHSGEICVDLETEMEILAGVRIKPSMPLGALDTKIGKAVEPKFTSTIISVKLDKGKLQQLGMENQEIYFQAAAMPVDSANPFAETQVSECDRYLIDPVVEGGGGEPGDPGTKMPDNNMPPPGDGTMQPPPDTGGKGAN